METEILSKTVCMIVLMTVFSGGLTVAKAGESAEKTINFSGRVWEVRSSDTRAGPGPNYFSDSSENVWVDGEGRLHLRITGRNHRLQCAEVICRDTLGLGEYRFEVSTPLSRLNPDITLGLFTWSNAPAHAHREIDIECAKWGDAADTNNAQFVVQPYEPPGRLLRYRVPEKSDAVSYSFLWLNDSVFFQCAEDIASGTVVKNSVIKEWRFDKGPVPPPGDERVHINLWHSDGHARVASNDTEVVIGKFLFTPLKDLPAMGKPHGTTSALNPAVVKPGTGETGAQKPGVIITTPPPATLKPGPGGTGKIAGRAVGIKAAECRVVIFARGDTWYVQPLARVPCTPILEDGTWETQTHGGSEYAVLLVKASYKPPATTQTIPEVGGDVLAVGKTGR